MSKLETRGLTKDEYHMWDLLVANSAQGTVFHTTDWLTICNESLKRPFTIYGCFKNRKLVGGCSLFPHRSALFRIASSIVLMTPYGGIVQANSPSSRVREQEQTYRDIIVSLCNIFDKERFDSIQIVNSPGFVDVRPFTWTGWKSNIHYAYYFDLKNDIEKNVSKKVRNTVRKAIKHHITVKKVFDAAIFYDLFSMTYTRQHLQPPVTREFIEKIMNLLKSKKIGRMWIAETPQKTVAAAEIIVWDKNRAYRWSAASHNKFKETGATSLLLLEIFQSLKKKGFAEINLLAANTPHLAKFISSFNPKLVPYYSLEKKTRVGKIATAIFHQLAK